MVHEKKIDINDIPDSDVGEPIELYELTLEQMLRVPVQLDAATKKKVRIQDFLENGKFSGATQYLSKHINNSNGNPNYTTVIATAIVHGLSVFQHEHESILNDLSTLNDDILLNNYRVYNKMYRNFKPVVNFGALTKLVWCDSQAHDTISHHASTLNISCGQLTTVCLCMSYAESTLLPEYITKECKEKADMFNIACNICLDNLKCLKY